MAYIIVSIAITHRHSPGESHPHLSLGPRHCRWSSRGCDRATATESEFRSHLLHGLTPRYGQEALPAKRKAWKSSKHQVIIQRGPTGIPTDINLAWYIVLYSHPYPPKTFSFSPPKMLSFSAHPLPPKKNRLWNRECALHHTKTSTIQNTHFIQVHIN